MDNYLDELYQAKEACEQTLILNEDLIRFCVDEIKQDKNIKNGFYETHLKSHEFPILELALIRMGYDVEKVCSSEDELTLMKVTWI